MKYESRELARVKYYKWDLTQSKFGYYCLPSVALRRYTPSATGLQRSKGTQRAGADHAFLLAGLCSHLSPLFMTDHYYVHTSGLAKASRSLPNSTSLLLCPSSRGHLFLCVAGALCVPFCVSEHCLTGTIAWMLGVCFSCQDMSSLKAKTIAFTSRPFPLTQIDSVLLK